MNNIDNMSQSTLYGFSTATRRLSARCELIIVIFLLFSIHGCSNQAGQEMATGKNVAPPIVQNRMEPTIDELLAAKIDAKRLEQAIHAAADYMIRSCDRQGRFNYLVNLNPEIKVRPSYRIIRHAGSMYTLEMYYRWCSDPRALQAVQRAADYIERNALHPMPTQENLLGIWSVKNKQDAISQAILESISDEDSTEQEETELTVDDTKIIPIVRLGNVGLGLLALAGLHKIDPASIPLTTPQGVGRFLVFMRKPDGSFYATYDPEENGLCDKWYCEYYPGEAILGLLMLQEIDPDAQWLQAATDGIQALAWQRRKETHPPFDHWALLATAKLMQATDADAMRFPRGLWRSHAENICHSMLSEYQNNGMPKRRGDLSGDGVVCRTSCRLEGLLAARTFLQDEALKRQISLAAADGIDFLLQAQIHGGPCDGAFPGYVPNQGEQLSASLEMLTTEVRIDYVQHALSALLACADSIGLKPSK